MEEFKEVLKSNIPPGEKNKKINEFINNVPSADVDKVLSALKEDPTLDLTSIHLKLAKVFKREAMVIEILKNGNPFSVNQAVKFSWMYQPGSLLENPTYLVEELFPKCSYSCRLKIINSIGTFMKNQEKVDGIYNAIERRYGFYTALPLLKGCSKAQITSVLSSRNVELRDDQLLKIAKGHPEIAVSYLRQHYEKKSAREATEYSSTIKYLVDVLPQEYIKLMADFPEFLSCSRRLRLGIRRSRKILRINPQTIIDNTNTEYEPVINIRQFQRLVPWDQYKSFVLTLVIKGKEIFADQLDSTWKWIDNLSEVKKLELLRSVFTHVFGKPLEECPNYLNSDIIQLLPHVQKQTAIQWKIENDDSNSNCAFRLGKDKVWIHMGHVKGFWVIFKPTQYSIPELTQLLYVEQNVDSRAVLYKCLIFTCVVNEDSKGMTKVLQLLNKRCRNDQPMVRMRILDSLATASNHMQLEKEHWDEIMELIQLCELYQEFSYCMDTDFESLAHKAIVYHLNNKLPFDAWIELPYAHWELPVSGVKEPLDQKKLIEAYILSLSTMGGPVSQKGGQFSAHILRGAIQTISYASDWNSKNDTSTLGRISILSHPWLASAIQQIFKKDSHWYDQLSQVLLFKLLKREEDFNVDSLITSASVTWTKPLLSFFFRQDPERLSGDAEQILHALSKTQGKSAKHLLKFLRALKSLNYLSLTSKLVELSATVVCQEDVDDVSKTCTALKILTTLAASPSEFLEHAKKFYPVDTKVDATKDQIELDYQIHTCVAKCFKKLKLNPGSSDVFSAIEKFCVGDYLKLVSASLYSCCSHVPQEETMPFLRKQLIDRPVSVKKNMIRLFFMVSPVDGKSDILREMWNRERNPSIRAEIFKQTYRQYNNYRSQATWSDLKSAIELLSSEDVPCLDFLRSSVVLDDSPKEFLSDFFESILEAVARTDSKEGAISPIVTRITNVIYNVSDSLLDRLVKGEIRSPTTPKKSIFKPQLDSDFCVEYLLAAVYLASLGNDQVLPHRLGLMRIILKDAIENHWNSSKLTVTVQTFIMKFYKKQQLLENSIRGIEGRKREILEGLLEEVEANQRKTFKQKLYLDLALLQLDEVIVMETDKRPPSEQLSSFGKKIGLLLESYVAEYGGEMIGPIFGILSHFVYNIFMAFMEFDDDDDDDEDNIVHLIEGLLTHSTSRPHLIVAIRFLPSEAPSRTNILASTSYVKIIKIITDSQDLAVQVWWNIR